MSHSQKILLARLHTGIFVKGLLGCIKGVYGWPSESRKKGAELFIEALGPFLWQDATAEYGCDF